MDGSLRSRIRQANSIVWQLVPSPALESEQSALHPAWKSIAVPAAGRAWHSFATESPESGFGRFGKGSSAWESRLLSVISNRLQKRIAPRSQWDLSVEYIYIDWSMSLKYRYRYRYRALEIKSRDLDCSTLNLFAACQGVVEKIWRGPKHTRVRLLEKWPKNRRFNRHH